MIEVDPTRKFTLPKGYLSYSQLSTYLQCPRLYYYLYIEGRESKANYAMLEGSVWHKQVEIYSRGETYFSFKTTLMDECKKAGLTPPNAAMSTDIENRNLKFWEEYKKVSEEWEVFESEKQIGQNEDGEGEPFEILGVPFLMYLDITYKPDKNGHPTVVGDYKVSKRAKTQKNAEDSLQLSLYALGSGLPDVAFISLSKEKADKALTGKKVSDIVSVQKVTKTQRERKHAAEVVWCVADQITKGNFPLCSPEPPFGAFWNACSEKGCSCWDSCRGRK